MPALISLISPFGRRGVAFLDDPGDLAACPQDSAVAGGPFDHGRDDRGGGAALPMPRDERGQAGGTQQRHVPREQDECPALTSNGGFWREQGVAGP